MSESGLTCRLNVLWFSQSPPAHLVSTGPAASIHEDVSRYHLQSLFLFNKKLIHYLWSPTLSLEV